MPTFWISWKSTAGCLQSGCGVRMPCTSRWHGYDLPPDLGLAADAAAAPAGGGCEAASMNPYIIIGALLLALGAGGAGYVKGQRDNEARHVAAALVQAEAGAGRQLAAAEQEARLLARELEDRAYADPVAVP